MKPGDQIIYLNNEDAILLSQFLRGVFRGMESAQVDIPDKFYKALTCLNQIINKDPTTQDEVMGVLDSIGGYASALMLEIDRTDSKKESERLKKDLFEIMALAKRIEDQMNRAFIKFDGLKIVDDQEDSES